MTLQFYLKYNIHKFVGFQPSCSISVTHFHCLFVLFVRFVSAFSVTPYDYTFCISCVFICVLLFLVSSFPPSILCCRSLSLQEPQGILFIYSLLGNQSCRNHTLPTLWHSQNPPVPCFVSSFSPDTAASYFHHWGDLHSEGPMAERGSPVADKAYGSRAYGVLLSGAGDGE